MPRPVVDGETRIERGCTEGWVDLARTPSGVYIVSLKAQANPENRWLPPFTRAIHRAFEAVEWHLEHEAGDTPAALLTVSESEKFFSNGIDPDGRYAKSLGLSTISRTDEVEGNTLMMSGFIRPLQLPIPTVCALNGHAFGAGMMFAAGHDYRLQREDKGYMCAVEIEIGVGIPPPEMALFRHIMSDPAWYETVLGAKRWGAAEALREGLVVAACSADRLFPAALKFAEKHAQLARTEGRRLLYQSIKNQAKGHVNRAVMEHTFPKGALPPHMARDPELVRRLDSAYTYLRKHINEHIDSLPRGNIMGGLMPAPGKRAKL